MDWKAEIEAAVQAGVKAAFERSASVEDPTDEMARRRRRRIELVEDRMRRDPVWAEKIARRHAAFRELGSYDLEPAAATLTTSALDIACECSKAANSLMHDTVATTSSATTSIGAATSALVPTMVPVDSTLGSIQAAAAARVTCVLSVTPSTCSMICLGGDTSVTSTTTSPSAMPASAASTQTSPAKVLDSAAALLVESESGCSDMAAVHVPQVLDTIPVATSPDPNDDTPRDDKCLFSTVVTAQSPGMRDMSRTLPRTLWSPIILVPWDPGLPLLVIDNKLSEIEHGLVVRLPTACEVNYLQGSLVHHVYAKRSFSILQCPLAANLEPCHSWHFPDGAQPCGMIPVFQFVAGNYSLGHVLLESSSCGLFPVAKLGVQLQSEKLWLYNPSYGLTFCLNIISVVQDESSCSFLFGQQLEPWPSWENSLLVTVYHQPPPAKPLDKINYIIPVCTRVKVQWTVHIVDCFCSCICLEHSGIMFEFKFSGQKGQKSTCIILMAEGAIHFDSEYFPWEISWSSLFDILGAIKSTREICSCILWSRAAVLLFFSLEIQTLKGPMEQWDPDVTSLLFSTVSNVQAVALNSDQYIFFLRLHSMCYFYLGQWPAILLPCFFGYLTPRGSELMPWKVVWSEYYIVVAGFYSFYYEPCSATSDSIPWEIAWYKPLGAYVLVGLLGNNTCFDLISTYLLQDCFHSELDFHSAHYFSILNQQEFQFSTMNHAILVGGPKSKYYVQMPWQGYLGGYASFFLGTSMYLQALLSVVAQPSWVHCPVLFSGFAMEIAWPLYPTPCQPWFSYCTTGKVALHKSEALQGNIQHLKIENFQLLAVKLSHFVTTSWVCIAGFPFGIFHCRIILTDYNKVLPIAWDFRGHLFLSTGSSTMLVNFDYSLEAWFGCYIGVTCVSEFGGLIHGDDTSYVHSREMINGFHHAKLWDPGTKFRFARMHIMLSRRAQITEEFNFGTSLDLVVYGGYLALTLAYTSSWRLMIAWFLLHYGPAADVILLLISGHQLLNKQRSSHYAIVWRNRTARCHHNATAAMVWSVQLLELFRIIDQGGNFNPTGLGARCLNRVYHFDKACADQDYYLAVFLEQVRDICYLNIVKVCVDYGTHCDLVEVIKLHVLWDPGGSTWHRLEVKPKFKEGGMLATSPTATSGLDRGPPFFGLACSRTSWTSFYKYTEEGNRTVWLGTGWLRPPLLMSPLPSCSSSPL